MLFNLYMSLILNKSSQGLGPLSSRLTIVYLLVGSLAWTAPSAYASREQSDVAPLQFPGEVLRPQREAAAPGEWRMFSILFR